MKTPHPPFNLTRFLDRISGQMNLAGNITVNRPGEISSLEAIPRDELERAAARRGLRVVRRMGGSIYDFTRRPAADFPYGTLKYPQ